MKPPECFILYMTFPSKAEAVAAGRALAEERLIACANIHEGVTSLYRWEGAVRQEEETVLTAKTSRAKLEGAMAAAKRLHSYRTPCIIAYPIAEGFPPYLQWIADETGSR